MQLSIIIPAYRAEKLLKKNIPRIVEKMDLISKDYEILIISGRGPDRTVEVAGEIEKRNKRARLVYRDARLGKGKALSIGFSEAKGNIVVYTDADLEIDPKYILNIIEMIKEGFDIAIVSKQHYDSKFQSPLVRKILGKGYNGLVKIILGSRLMGHQGGLKGFKKEVIKKILPYVKDDWWFWDTEVLMIAQWLGYSIHETPITGSYGFGDSTVILWKECFRMFKSILELKARRMGELSKLKPAKKS